MKASKFICGQGNEILYYCEICGLPFLNPLDALDCESSHKKHCEEYLKTLSRDEAAYQPINYLPHLTRRKRKKIYEKMLKDITDFTGNVKDKSFLDLGSCHGYFCFELARLGARITGIENSKKSVYISRCLSKAYGFDYSNPRFYEMNMLNYPISVKYDYVLLLNVFHYILRKDELEAWNLLNRLADNSGPIFLTMGHERQYEIPKMIIESSNLNYFRTLGKARGKGPRYLFAFWK